MKIYKVGGFVRDYLLGTKANDIDWVVVESSPEEMIWKGFIPVGKDFPVFLHWKTREEHALARKEMKRGVGYHGFDFEFEATDIVNNGLLRLPFSQKQHNKLKDIKFGNVDVSKLGEEISEDIEYLRKFDYTDDGRVDHIRDLTERISAKIRNEIELYNIYKRRKYVL
jgi:hypothetical protein